MKKLQKLNLESIILDLLNQKTEIRIQEIADKIGAEVTNLRKIQRSLNKHTAISRRTQFT